ncbi:hypothetical protein RHGRI_000172 [Rhododendron griersonianum]|uniref:Uncharacterized protein n=1 Tax=Rhododendron griersonianum TaxID=479676 RepID=A0AAV6LID5_9ERIC|nr:hypothetical protein RHGRI_000172 [Rhododendron griersonianum]
MKDHYVNHLQVLEMMNDMRNVFERRSFSSEYQKEEILSPNNLVSENTNDKENKSGTGDESVPPFAESKDVKLDLKVAQLQWMAKNQNDDIVQDEVIEIHEYSTPLIHNREEERRKSKVNHTSYWDSKSANANSTPSNPASTDQAVKSAPLAMAENLPKENSNARPISQGSKETVVPEAIEEKLPLVSVEEKKCPVSAEEETKVEGAVS